MAELWIVACNTIDTILESLHTNSMSDTSHVHLHMRVPTGLLAAVDALAKRDLLTRTSWINSALLSACELAQDREENPTVSERLAALEQQLPSRVAEADRAGRGFSVRRREAGEFSGAGSEQVKIR